MGQPPLVIDTSTEEPEAECLGLQFLPASLAGEADEGPCVVVVKTPLEFFQWVASPPPGLQWLQVENLLDETEVWASASRRQGDAALDVVVSDPGNDYPALYRLVDVSKVRDVRVTIPVEPGFMKSLRLAASLQLPVRLLPGQSSAAVLEELEQALEFYLHNPVVEAPVEPFHSCLASMGDLPITDLWMILELDPNSFVRYDQEGKPTVPEGVAGSISNHFVEDHVAGLLASGSECAECRWKDLCRGYFKLPDPNYSCAGIINIFDRLQQASVEMDTDLTDFETNNEVVGGLPETS
jgi:hypothetical protein